MLNIMYKIVALILLCCLSLNSKIDVGSANSYSRFLYPTNSINDNILYFNQYDGTIVKQNIATGNEEIVFDLVPSATTSVQISPDQAKMLIYTPNISYPKYQAPFFDPTQKSPDFRWWIYDFKSQQKTLLGEKINSVSWYSNSEIIYVFNNQEIAIAPIDNLSSFSTLYKKNPMNLDLNKNIISNNINQIVSLKDGYIIGSKNKFKYITSNNYKIAANPNVDFFIEYSSNLVKVINWDGLQQSTLNLSNIIDVEVMESGFLVLLSDGQMIKYTNQGKEEARLFLKPEVNNLYYIGLSDKILISQNDTVSVYNLNTKENGVDLSNIVTSTDTSLDNSSSEQAQEVSTNNSNILLLVGGISCLVLGVGVFIWKLRKR